ncbi:MAG TPA: cyclic nucleotide-binding domain-containing protein [bacterium]|nr:cyclic nucleotide-binding domain-containing protein [bacterium]
MKHKNTEQYLFENIILFGIYKTYYQMANSNIIKELKKVGIFKNISSQYSLEKLANISKIKYFPPDVKILNENDESDSLYILLNGTVKIIKKNITGEEFEIEKFESNETENYSFNESALVDNGTNLVSLYSIAYCEFLIINKYDFNSLAEKNYDIGYNAAKEIIKVLTGQIKKIEHNIKILTNALISDIRETDNFF